MEIIIRFTLKSSQFWKLEIIKGLLRLLGIRPKVTQSIPVHPAIKAVFWGEEMSELLVVGTPKNFRVAFFDANDLEKPVTGITFGAGGNSALQLNIPTLDPAAQLTQVDFSIQALAPGTSFVLVTAINSEGTTITGTLDLEAKDGSLPASKVVFIPLPD